MSFVRAYYIVAAILNLILSYVAAVLLYHENYTAFNVLAFFAGLMAWVGIGAYIRSKNWLWS